MNGCIRASGGQSILETVLLLPLLLVLLAGAYWSFRNLSLSNAAESAAHAHLLRTGRRLPSAESRLARTIHPEDNSVRFHGGNGPLSVNLPLFGGMAGNTVASVTAACRREQAGAFIDLPAHDVRREAEGAVDCWGKGTKSGSIIRGAVDAVLIAGAFR